MTIIVIGKKGAISHALLKFNNYLFFDNLDDLDFDKVSSENKITTVIYCRGYSQASPSHYINSKKLIISNVYNPNKIYKELDKFKINLFIYLSTNKIKYFEPYLHFLIIEKFIKFFRPYLWSKWIGENYLTNNSKKNNCKLLVLRLPPIIGTIPKGKLKYIIKHIKILNLFKVIIPDIKINFLSISNLNNLFLKVDNNFSEDNFIKISGYNEQISLHGLIKLVYLIKKNSTFEINSLIISGIISQEFVNDLTSTIKVKY